MSGLYAVYISYDILY